MAKNNNNMPQEPTQAEIQRQSIQRDMDKQAKRDAQSDEASNIIGQHNYSYDAQMPNQRGLMASMRRKLKPFLRWCRHIHYKLEESARKRKRYIVLAFVAVMLGSFVYGHINKIGIAVANSSIGSVRTFVNSDAMEMTHEKYDANNQTIQADFVTKSPSGEISPQNLSASFVFAQMPKQSGLQRPTLNLIPTFNNHYTVIIHHVYKGFGGVQISFHDNSKMSVGTLATEAKSNGGNQFLSDDENKEITQIGEQGGSEQDTARLSKLLKKLQARNISNFVIGERYIAKHYPGYINPTASPRDLALSDLRSHLNADNSNLKGDQTLIKQDKARIKSDQGKIRQINRNADTGSKASEIEETAQEVKTLTQEISNYQIRMRSLKTDVHLTLSRIHHVESDISVLPKTKSPRPLGTFNNSAHH